MLTVSLLRHLRLRENGFSASSCNRGIVINLEHAVDFDGSMFLMDDDNNIPVSRKLLKNARQTFMEFLFQ